MNIEMKKRTFPLDLSARAYPMMKSRHTQSNFRFSATLAEKVDPTALKQALSDVLAFYPNFRAKIVPSFFWHKFKQNDAPLIVKEDDRPPLLPLRKKDTNGYPFRLAYLENEIILEVFHAITDGDIGALFLSDLLTRYAEIVRDLPAHSFDRGLRLEDAFIKHGRKTSFFKASLGKYNGKSAIALGKRDNYLPTATLLSQEISISDLKAAAKANDATVTEYVAACYIAAILQGEKLPLKKPLCLFVPVNLRRFFASETLQNFVCFERITLEKGETDVSFAHILSTVRTQFREKITQENMQKRVDDVKLCFTLPIARCLPLFIKKPCFKFVKWILDKVRQTAILSNVGSLSLPPETAEIVKDVKFFLNIGKNTPLNVAVLSYGNVCHVDLTCGLKSSEIPARFFSLLNSQGKK